MNSASGLVIARGIQGNHHHVQISKTFHFSEMKLFKIMESMKCFSIIQDSSLMAERFICEFFSMKMTKNFSNSSI
jgi:hypothetical protein